jgi:hypothetical protein
MVSLAGIIGNNSIGYRHKFSKVNRAIYRSSFALLEKAMTDQRWHALEFAPNKFIDVVWGKPDYDRLLNCFDRIARGLYHHRFERRFRGRTKTMLAYLTPNSQNPAEFQRFMRDKVRLELDGKPRIGANPDVFSFQFTDPDQFGLSLLHLLFYGGLDVCIALIPTESRVPRNIAMDLIEAGIETTITLGEREYHFNAGPSKGESSG